MRLTAICNRPKQIIFASGGLGLLQMISVSDTGQYVSDDGRPPRGWIVRSHVSWRGERSISYNSVEISP